MASDGIRAGSLFWDLDIADQEKVLRKVDELGRKLDEVLNKRRTPPGGGSGPLDGLGEETDQAKNRLTELANEFTRLTA
ncbi:MAG TPA: hypothetical protein VFF10_05970, partial [Trueperaceae bacterium]|nr:hypothetical protein [Trueperaceae bacterium]